jgi:DNA topoisomerase-6 subunit B
MAAKAAKAKAASPAKAPKKAAPAAVPAPKKSPKKSKDDDAEVASAQEVIGKVRKSAKTITTSSTAEYFAKNLQQVGFSSPTKAVLTTLKEAMDNALDACEDAGILPDIKVIVHKLGAGTLKNTDQILIKVTDNGPGIDPDNVAMVFGEYLASSKFGRGRCSRGQQGIGISAATTWAMQTTATGAKVVTKQKSMRKAFSCVIDMDLKNNKGILRDKQSVEWDQQHGTSVEFKLDGRIMLNGEGGLLNYIRGTVLLNPHMTLSYDITDVKPQVVERVTKDCPVVPEATEPHPHTMKLGEFISHARLFGRMKCSVWLKKGFSRVSDKTMDELVSEQKLDRAILSKNIDAMVDEDFKKLFAALQDAKLMAPATTSVLSVGEDGLALSIRRLGDVDFFAVLSRKPMIADFKPVQVEVAIARLRTRAGEDQENPVQVLRFANRVPLQFDKAACAIVKAINSVTWRSYGLRQPKDSLPLGPYIIAVSVVSPFIKFKNASKETIDASDELVEELRRALMQTGQRLSRYLKREHKAGELEQRAQHIEQFGPILVETLARILEAPDARKQRAEEGLAKILERDTKGIKKDLKEADDRLATYLEDKKQRLSGFFAGIEAEEQAKAEAKAKAKAAEAKARALENGEEPPEEENEGSDEAEGDEDAAEDDDEGGVKTKKKAAKKAKTKRK